MPVFYYFYYIFVLVERNGGGAGLFSIEINLFFLANEKKFNFLFKRMFDFDLVKMIIA